MRDENDRPVYGQESHARPGRRIPGVLLAVLGGVVILVLLLYTIIPTIQRGTLAGEKRSHQPAPPFDVALVADQA